MSKEYCTRCDSRYYTEEQHYCSLVLATRKAVKDLTGLKRACIAARLKRKKLEQKYGLLDELE